MSTFTGSYTHHAGDQIILRGGDVWHAGNSSSLPFMGYTNNAWNWSNSGASTSCQLNPAAGAIVTTSCDYLGVDQTWYSGGSWVRPQINMDNPLSTSSPSSCSFEDSSDTFLNISGQYVIVDNLEFLGYCWNVTTPFNAVVNLGTNDEIKNSYWHGWTMGTTATGCGGCDSDEYWAVGPFSSGSLSTYKRIDHNVFDGSDSTYGNLSPASGNATGGVFLTPAEYDHNVLTHVSNGAKYYIFWSVHDNFAENISEPKPTGTHGNIFEWAPTNYTISTYYFNNVISNTFSGETIDMYPGASGSSKYGYIFNNVMWSIGNGGNCYMLEGDGTGGGPGSTIFFDNTSDSTCQLRNPGRGTNTATFQNSHFIGFSPSGVITDFTGINITPTDNGNEIWQTAGAACGSTANNYAPTSGACATVGAGANLTATCNGMDNSVAMAACKSGIGGVTYNTTTHAAVDNSATSRPSSGAWDAGAYEFTSGGSFTCSPSAVPANHSGNIALACTGVGTTWTPSTIFTVTGLAGTSLVSYSNSSNTLETVTIATGAAVGSASVNDATDSISTTIAVATATLVLAPTVGNVSTTPTLTLIGTNTLWTTETASTLLSVSGGGCSGESIATPTVTSNTAATAVLTTGSAACSITVTDNSTTASATFTVRNVAIAPATIPAHHSGHISLALTGSGTSWTGSTTFSASGVAGASVFSQTNTSGTLETVVVTTGSGTGTLTLTGSDGSSGTVTVATATLAVSPSSGFTGTTPAVTLTGTNTLWNSETPSTLFTVTGAGCSGESLGVPSVSSNTAATDNLTTGSLACTETITDNSTTAATTFTVTSAGNFIIGPGSAIIAFNPTQTDSNSGGRK